jgi:site-specific DNA recombinase
VTAVRSVQQTGPLNGRPSPGLRDVGYLRVSSEEQRERQSILTQRGEIERVCDFAGEAVVDWYPDDGVSGTIPFENRPEGARLLRDAAAGRFDCVVIYRFDRLARSQLELWRTIDAFERLGVAVRSIKENVDTTTPAGKMFLGVLASMAQFERDSIRQRAMDGCARVAREGKWNGGPRPPCGYRVVDQRLEVVEEEAPTVDLVYRLYLEGLNVHRVADYLNGSGLTQRGNRWNGGTVHRILSNSTYAGTLVWRKRRLVSLPGGKKKLVKADAGEQIGLDVPAIVDRATFDAVQQRLREGVNRNPRQSQHPYLLSGLVRCGNCGGVVYAGNGGPDYRYYRCAGRYFGDPNRCGAGGVRAAKLDAASWTDIAAWLHDPGPLLAALAEKMRAQDAEVAAIEAAVAGIDESLATKQAERERVVGAWRRALLSDEDMERELGEIAGEAAALSDRRAALALKLVGEQERRARLQSVDALLGRLREKAKDATPQTRQGIARDLVRRVVLTVGKGRGRKEPPRVDVEYAFDDPTLRTPYVTAGRGGRGGRSRRRQPPGRARIAHRSRRARKLLPSVLTHRRASAMAMNPTSSSEPDRAHAGVYADPEAANAVIERLRQEGYESNRIGVLSRDRWDTERADGDTGAPVATGAATGAVAGGVLGGVAGLLVGAGMLAVPGVGPILAGGVLASALGVGATAAAVGAGLGAATGGLIGALVGVGFSHEEAAYLDREVRAGKTIVTVHGDGERVIRHFDETGAQRYRPREDDKTHDAPPLA